jgi:hypothetical protein
MKRPAMLLSVALLGSLAAAPSAIAQTAALSEAEARAIATEAYLYFYPLVTMDVTRKQLINTEPGKGIGGPMNTFDNIAAFPTAEMRAVVRPNFDTLYSSGWVDLTREPMVGARHWRTLLSPPHARHVDRRVRLAGLAHDGHKGGQFPARPSAMERKCAG